MSATISDGFMESPDGALEEEAVTNESPSISPAMDGGAETEIGEPSAEFDPFAGSAEDVAAEETRLKVELFGWTDSVLGLHGADLELALDEAVKRFEKPRASLKRIIAARSSEKSK